MLRDDDIKELLSYAYIRAVAAQIGCSVDRPEIDRDSVDLEIQGHGKIADDSKIKCPKVQLQVKATAMDKPVGDAFTYRLKKKNYDELREHRQMPRLLVVYVMPPDKNQWVVHSENGLLCQQGAYWCSLLGLGDSTNATSNTVTIPTANHFSPANLFQIMRKASRFEAIGNGI